jgi:hypothetical protein
MFYCVLGQSKHFNHDFDEKLYIGDIATLNIKTKAPMLARYLAHLSRVVETGPT